MKALADENFPRGAVDELIRLGWDVVRTQDIQSAISDHQVAEIARAEKRLLLTLDKDFGEIWRGDSSASLTVVLFRLPRLTATEMIARILDVLTAGTDWKNSLWVADMERVRERAKPDETNPLS